MSSCLELLNCALHNDSVASSVSFDSVVSQEERRMSVFEVLKKAALQSYHVSYLLTIGESPIVSYFWSSTLLSFPITSCILIYLFYCAMYDYFDRDNISFRRILFEVPNSFEVKCYQFLFYAYLFWFKIPMGNYFSVIFRRAGRACALVKYYAPSYNWEDLFDKYCLFIVVYSGVLVFMGTVSIQSLGYRDLIRSEFDRIDDIFGTCGVPFFNGWTISSILAIFFFAIEPTWMTIVVYAPIREEWCKRVFPNFWIFITVFEIIDVHLRGKSLAHFDNLFWWQARLSFHYFTMTLPFHYGIVVHALWNACSIYVQHGLPLMMMGMPRLMSNSVNDNLPDEVEDIVREGLEDLTIIDGDVNPHPHWFLDDGDVLNDFPPHIRIGEYDPRNDDMYDAEIQREIDDYDESVRNGTDGPYHFISLRDDNTEPSPSLNANAAVFTPAELSDFNNFTLDDLADEATKFDDEPSWECLFSEDSRENFRMLMDIDFSDVYRFADEMVKMRDEGRCSYFQDHYLARVIRSREKFESEFRKNPKATNNFRLKQYKEKISDDQFQKKRRGVRSAPRNRQQIVKAINTSRVDKSKLSANSFWRVPLLHPRKWTPHKPSLRQLMRNPMCGRDWVLTRSKELVSRSSGKKDECAMGSGGAEFLFRASLADASLKVIEEKLSSATVYWASMNREYKAPVPVQIADLGISGKRLPKMPDGCMITMEYLDMTQKTVFKRDQPIWRALCLAVSKDEVTLSLINQARNVWNKYAEKKAHHPTKQSGNGEEIPSLEVRDDASISDASEPYKEVINMLRDMAKDLDPKTGAGLIAASTLFVSLFKAKSWSDVVLILSNSAAMVNLGAKFSFDWESLASKLTTSKQSGNSLFMSYDIGKAIPSYMWDGLKSILSVFVELISSSFLNPRWEILTGFSIHSVLNEAYKVILKDSAKTVANLIVTSVWSFVEKIRDCIKARSFVPLFSGSRSVVSWRARCIAYTTYPTDIVAEDEAVVDMTRLKKLKDAGLIPLDITFLSAQQFHAELDCLIKDGNEFLRFYRGDQLMVSDLRSVISKMITYMEQYHSAAGGSSMRMRPLGIYLHGKAGCGKSMLMSDIFTGFARKFGYGQDACDRYYLQVGVNFQDGMRYQWCICMDDVDQSTGPPALGQMSFFEWVVRVSNNAPLPVEQSDNSQKGRIFARPLLLLFSSNFCSNNVLQPYCRDFDVFWRRFDIRVEVATREEYRNSAGGIDTDKVKSNRDGEVQLLKVECWMGGYGKQVIMSKSNFLKYCYAHYELHREEQKKEISKNLGKLYCPQCMMTWSNDLDGQRCSCEIPEVQSKVGLAIGTIFAFALGHIAYQRSMALMMKFSEVVEEGRALVTYTKGMANLTLRNVLMTPDEFMKRVVASIGTFTTAFVTSVVVFSGSLYLLRRLLSKPRKQAADFYSPAPDAWVRAPQEYTPGLMALKATWTREELIDQVRQSLVQLVTLNSGEHISYGMIVADGLIAVTKHSLYLEPNSHTNPRSKVRILHGSAKYMYIHGDNLVSNVSNEFTLIRVPGVMVPFNMKKKIIVTIPSTVSVFHSAYMINPVDEIALPRARPVVYSYPGQPKEMIIRTDSLVGTTTGDCGSPYIVNVDGSWFVAGLHCYMDEPNSWTAGVVMDHNLCGIAASSIGCRFQEVSIPLSTLGQLPEKQSFTTFPDKSEIWTAHSQAGISVNPIGCATVNMARSTFKSNCHSTLFAEDFQDFCIEHAGSYPAFVKPNFKGKMVDDKWVSPWGNALTCMKEGDPQVPYLFLALACYVSPLRYMAQPPSRTISSNEGVVGVPGTVIHSFDLNTSVGPLRNGKKKYQVQIHNGIAYLSPELAQHHEDYKAILEEGEIPVPLALSVLKDEPITVKKNDECQVRVFNCVPFSYNLMVKMHFAPIEAFIRANRHLFESMVGVNMTSLDADFLARSLLAFGDGVIFDADLAKQDKTVIPWSQEMVHLTFRIFAIFLGIPTYVESLSRGCAQAVHITKGDFYRLGRVNISGIWITLLANGVDNSISMRYMYYRMKYPNGLPPALLKRVSEWMVNLSLQTDCYSEIVAECDFRENIIHQTFGDDSNSAVNPTCKFFDPERIPSIGSELGKTYTDGAKSSSIKLRSLSEVVFLKRNYEYWPSLNSYVAKLSKKTMAKMLTICVKSSLSEIDHNATILTDVLRECVYHGEDFYNQMRVRFLAVGEKYNLSCSAYFRMPTFDYYYQKLVDGSFSAWEPTILEPSKAPELQSGNTSTMSEVTELSTPAVSMQDVVIDEPLTLIPTGLGAQHSQTSHSTGGIRTEGNPYPDYPVTDIGDFLCRRINIQHLEMLSTDLLFSGPEMDPHALFLANPAVAAKTKDFFLLRGDLEVHGVVTTPPGSYGRYVILFYPLNQVPTGISNLPIVPMAYPQYIHVEIDVSNSTNFSVTLPWLCPFHAGVITQAATDPTPVVGQWTMKLMCLQPIANAVGSLTPTGYVELYANFATGYHMSLPFKQSGHPVGGKPPTSGVTTQKQGGKSGAIGAQSTGSKPSGFASKVATAATVAGASIPMLAPYAAPLAAGASAVSKILDIFGFTRARAQEVPTPLVRRPFANLANIDCDDTSEIAGLSNSNQVSIDNRLYGLNGQDESSFEFMMSKWTLIGSVPWNTATVHGTEIKSFAVTPFISAGSHDSACVYPVAGYLGLPFAYWRGDMEYRFMIPMSKFHRGSIQVVWTPTAGIPVAGDVTNINFNQIYDVQTGTDLYFSVGYNSPEPMLPSTPALFTPNIVSGRGNGIITIKVVNPLIAQTATANTTIFVYARAKSNMQFAIPRTSWETIDNLGALTTRDFASTVTLQAGALGDDNVTDDSIELVPSPGYFDCKEWLIGEEVKSARALIQKFSHLPVLNWGSTQANGGAIWLQHYPVRPGTGQNATMSITNTQLNWFTWAGWYSVLFYGIAGSAMYKIVNTGVNPQAFGLSAEPSGSIAGIITGLSLSPMNAIWTVPQADAVEISVPNYYHRLFHPTRPMQTWSTVGVNTILNDTTRWDRVEVPKQHDSTTSPFLCMSIYTAMGPDIRLHRFVGVRPVSMNITPSATPYLYGSNPVTGA